MSNISLPPNLALDQTQNDQAKHAEVQVTSSDILQSANQIRQSTFKRPKQTIQDLDELRLFQLTKRKEYEQQLNKNRLNFGQWMRYAKWEIEHNHDFKRFRSIMERALEVNVQHVPFWVRYIETELLYKNVNHARNLLDRAVTTIPRTDKLWFMYVQTEESLANFRGVRSVFERWLLWKPPKQVWQTYIAFEQRYDEVENVRLLYVRYALEFPGESEVWLNWALSEMSGVSDSVSIARIRGIFETGIDTLVKYGNIQNDGKFLEFLASWANWEVSVRETERAGAIYKTVLDLDFISKDQKTEISENFTEFESKHGGNEDALRLKKLLQYEKELLQNPQDHDLWWEYVKLQETEKPAEEIVEVLKSSVQSKPTHKQKLIWWRRYVFLWIKLAWLQEFSLGAIDDARQTWKSSLELMAKEKFSFAKLWILYAEFELRNQNLDVSRKILGRAIGQTSKYGPKHKVFKYYISHEKKLGEWERVRKLYEKWLELALVWGLEAESLAVLKEYVEFEMSHEETERCVEIFKAVISFGKSANYKLTDYFAAFIEYLKDEMLYDHARDVFRQWLEVSSNSEVWTTFALFESQILSPGQMDQLESASGDEIQFSVGSHHLAATRAVFNEAYKFYRSANDGVNAIELLDAWKQYESDHGTPETVKSVEEKVPASVRKRRTVNGVEEVYEEYEFPQSKPDVSKFLANARKWAQKGN